MSTRKQYKAVKGIIFDNLTIEQLQKDIEENKAIDGKDDYFSKERHELNYSFSITNFLDTCRYCKDIEIFNFILDYVNKTCPDIHGFYVSVTSPFIRCCLNDSDEIFNIYFNFLKENYKDSLFYRKAYNGSEIERLFTDYNKTINNKRTYKYLEYMIEEFPEYIIYDYHGNSISNIIIILENISYQMTNHFHDTKLSEKDIENKLYLEKIKNMIFLYIKDHDDKVKIIDFKPKNSLELMLIVDDFELKIPKNIQDKIFKYYSK